MARVTVEDCIKKVANRFDLVILSAYRVHMMRAGEPALVEKQRDKKQVIALREIADEAIAAEDLREALIHSMQKCTEVDEVETPEENISNAEHIKLLQGVEAHDEKDDEVTNTSMQDEEILKDIMESQDNGKNKL